MTIHKEGPSTTPHPLQHPRIIRRNADALVLADLDTIRLAELNEQTGTLMRVDRKYIITRSHIPDIMSGLNTDVEILSVTGVRSRAYASTYFDTPGPRSFLDTTRPRRRRYKIRICAYLSLGIAFLEIKIRGARNTIVKTHIPCSVEDTCVGRVTAEGGVRVRKTLTIAACGTPTPGSPRPVLCSSYTRTILLASHGDGRATTDSDLKWTNLRHVGTGDGGGAGPETSDSVIIETKSSPAPSVLDHLPRERGYRPAHISKYATAMAVLDPSLPRNWWTRTLSRYFIA